MVSKPPLTQEELDVREAQLTARLARIEEMEAQAIRREKAAKEREKAKKQVLLRLSPSLWDDIAAWAEDDFRSINAQIEFLLTEAVRQRKKGKSRGGGNGWGFAPNPTRELSSLDPPLRYRFAIAWKMKN